MKKKVIVALAVASCGPIFFFGILPFIAGTPTMSAFCASMKKDLQVKEAQSMAQGHGFNFLLSPEPPAHAFIVDPRSKGQSMCEIQIANERVSSAAYISTAN